MIVLIAEIGQPNFVGRLNKGDFCPFFIYDIMWLGGIRKTLKGRKK